MKISGFVKKVVETECILMGTKLQEITLTPKQANVLTEKICCTFGIRPVPVVLSNELLFDKKGEQIYGQCVRYKVVKLKRIFLYRDGNNVETLTHEIAHLQRYDHSVNFHQVWLDMMVYFKKNLMKSFVKKPKTKTKTIKERKPTMKMIIKNIVEELEYEAVNKTLKMKMIGIALLEVKMNNMENITIIKKELIKRGYNIV